ncbi:MAG: hypothetical protein JWN48_3324 [Myxococcaceae bacterium]|nr:hypothetical protein [Myxococcaceae bacterium]
MFKVCRCSALLLTSLLTGCLHGFGHDSAADEPVAIDAGTSASTADGLDAGVTLGLAQGKIRGKRLGTAQAFLGIPYAKPPVGERRFMPPEPAEAWTGTLAATDFGPSCIQPPGALSATNAQSEDCLSLNVYVPAASKQPLPVMVWIHGGAFVSGGSSQYDGSKLASDGSVIVVTLNYRLGALGFAALAELDEARPGTPSGNDGLRDQQLALQWVQDNIAAFQGDPENVTVFGESAGGASTCVHFVSPRARSLGKQFIVESGSCVGSPLIGTRDGATAVSQELSSALCPGAGSAAACLRGKEASEIASWGADRGIFGAGWGPTASAEDDLLPASPAALIADGQHSPGALLLGTNKNEWGLFTLLQNTKVSSVGELGSAIETQFAAVPAAVPAIKAHYTATDENAADTFVRLVTDAFFRCPTRTLARAASAAGNPTFLYSFEQGLAYHAYEIPYVFGTPTPALGASVVEPLHGVIADYWSHFARTGDPNGGKSPTWPAYQQATDPHLRLVDQPVAASGLSRDDCDFWDALNGQ